MWVGCKIGPGWRQLGQLHLCGFVLKWYSAVAACFILVTCSIGGLAGAKPAW